MSPSPRTCLIGYLPEEKEEGKEEEEKKKKKKKKVEEEEEGKPHHDIGLQAPVSTRPDKHLDRIAQRVWGDIALERA